MLPGRDVKRSRARIGARLLPEVRPMHRHRLCGVSQENSRASGGDYSFRKLFGLAATQGVAAKLKKLLTKLSKSSALVKFRVA